MLQPGHQQDKHYRRGVVLGLTIAEVMILLIFVLLMVLAATLANREKKIDILGDGGADTLIDELVTRYPDVEDADAFWKELFDDLEAVDRIENDGEDAQREQNAEDAALGREVRRQADAAGARDARDWLEGIPDEISDARKGQFPPFISLGETDDFFFEPGRASLSPTFDTKLRNEVIPELDNLIREYNVDVVEVIGHTDEVPIPRSSNLDSFLIDASEGQFPIERLTFADNAGLAMGRAVSVVRVLRSDPRLRDIKILPLSGAQMIVPVDTVADGSATFSDERRRRIEIRLRRSTQQANTGSSVVSD